MEVDENIDIVSKPAKKKKEKGSDRLSKDSVKVTPSRDDKASTISHGKSKQAAEGELRSTLLCASCLASGKEASLLIRDVAPHDIFT